eukprot:2028738-Amphidinium_carterae.1
MKTNISMPVNQSRPREAVQALTQAASLKHIQWRAVSKTQSQAMYTSEKQTKVIQTMQTPMTHMDSA